MSRFTAPIAEQIWDMKYRFKGADGTAKDVTVEDTWRRIARDLARMHGGDLTLESSDAGASFLIRIRTDPAGGTT